MFIVICISSIYTILNCRVVIDSTCCPFPGLTPICDKSMPQVCNAIETRLAKVLIPLKPASRVPQGCDSVKTRLARALLPLKLAPAQRSSAKQNVVFRAHGVFKRVGL